ncbi:MAG: hypothetical protein HON90_05665 [Halobacteriovoraceae bacterium]|jgi:hypothetical protein|nr:hypothetical protein [Halobacteriovoraceae bacterium]
MKKIGKNLLKVITLASIIVSSNVQAGILLSAAGYTFSDYSYGKDNNSLTVRLADLSLASGVVLSIFQHSVGVILLTLDESSSEIEIEEYLLNNYTVLDKEPALTRDLSKNLFEALNSAGNDLKIVRLKGTEQGTILLREVSLGEQNITELLKKHDVDLSKPDVQKLIEGLKESHICNDKDE